MNTRGRRVRLCTTALSVVLAATAAGCVGSAPEPLAGPRPEMVAIGYGTQARASVATAVSTVRALDVDQNPTMRLPELLATRVPGVELIRRGDGEMSVRIRGASRSDRGEPLVVVDGMQLRGVTMSALASIAPQSILRIDVLKDAGSTAAYGVLGGNGVIVITTNRGH